MFRTLRARLRAFTPPSMSTPSPSPRPSTLLIPFTLLGPSTSSARSGPAASRRVRRVGRVAAHAMTVMLMLSVPAAAYADTAHTGPDQIYLAANDLPTVIGNLQTWVMGILAAVATLFLVL